MTTFITGGAGYLGRAILSEYEDQCIVYSRDEHKQWPLKAACPQHRFILGDVRDMNRIVSAMPLNLDCVIHAAAQKFVPEGETDAIEFARTNVEGTINVGLAAGMTRAQCAILISTDKAIEPVNAYGATKMIAERIWIELADRFPNTRFPVVRYGNVLGSTGSVVELFRKQWKENKCVGVTNPDATRFWMTARQAVATIKQAHHSAATGTITIPHMQGASMLTLLEAMKIDEWRELGMRPGEKLHESIVASHEYRRCVSTADGITIYRTVQDGKDPFAVSSNTVRQYSANELRALLP